MTFNLQAQLAETQIDPNSPLSDHIKPHPVVDIGTLGEKVPNGATKGESEKKQLSNGNLSDNSDPELEQSGTLKQRTFFRRFSFKGITKGKALNFFHRAGSDEVQRFSINPLGYQYDHDITMIMIIIMTMIIE